jgi:leucyl/phenylalanyl-tRNA--protein transferase
MLVRQLEAWGVGLIDCQMRTPHLASLGAYEIPRAEFAGELEALVNATGGPPRGRWTLDADQIVRRSPSDAQGHRAWSR